MNANTIKHANTAGIAPTSISVQTGTTKYIVAFDCGEFETIQHATIEDAAEAVRAEIAFADPTDYDADWTPGQPLPEETVEISPEDWDSDEEPVTVTAKVGTDDHEDAPESESETHTYQVATRDDVLDDCIEAPDAEAALDEAATLLAADHPTNWYEEWTPGGPLPHVTLVAMNMSDAHEYDVATRCVPVGMPKGTMCAVCIEAAENGEGELDEEYCAATRLVEPQGYDELAHTTFDGVLAGLAPVCETCADGFHDEER